MVIIDAGFASRANLALLKQRGHSYIVNITRGSRSKYADALEKETFEALPGRSDEQRVEVKKSPIPRTPRATWFCAAAPSAASRRRP